MRKCAQNQHRTMDNTHPHTNNQITHITHKLNVYKIYKQINAWLAWIMPSVLQCREQCEATLSRRKTWRAGRPRSVQDAVTPETGCKAIASHYVLDQSNVKQFPPVRGRALTLIRQAKSSTRWVAKTGSRRTVLVACTRENASPAPTSLTFCLEAMTASNITMKI